MTVGGVEVGGSWDHGSFDRLARLSAADFEELVGASLLLVDLGGSELTVVAVDRHDPRDRPADRRRGGRPFDVVLEADPSTEIGQGMHAVDVPGHGPVPLFLVPLAASADRRRLVASFG